MYSESGTLNEQGIWEKGWIAGHKYAKDHTIWARIKHTWRKHTWIDNPPLKHG